MRKPFSALSVLLCLLMFTASFSVFAQENNDPKSAAQNSGNKDCGLDQYKDALGNRESTNNYNAVNPWGYSGKYQQGESALQDAGWYNGDNVNRQVTSGGNTATYQDFSGTWSAKAQAMGVTDYKSYMACAACQEQAQNDVIAAQWRQAQAAGLEKYIGTTQNGVQVTRSGIIAACHLKGCGGTAACLSGSGGCTDGFRTSLYEYMQKMGGYDVQNSGDSTCKDYANTTSPRSETYGNPMCSEKIFANVQQQVQGVVQARNQIAAALDSPPESISAVANTPCMSQQMASITNQFSNAPSSYASQAVGAVTGNPAGTLVAGVFRSGYNSITSNMASWPQKIGLQAQFGKAMTYTFKQLGISNSPFADDLCGLMLDTVLNYIQCGTNLSLPSLGNLPTFNLPGSCEAQIARNTAYQAASKGSFDILNQKPSNGAVLPRNTPSPGSGTTN